MAAFAAYRTVTASVAAGGIVIWDMELYDASNSYNPATGVFTCPTSGYYFFSVSVYSDSGVNEVIMKPGACA